MAATVIDVHSWTASRGKDANRTYSVTWLVEATAQFDGPGRGLGAAGLPPIGSPWVYGNSTDTWATCRWTTKCRPHNNQQGTNGNFWLVDQVFTNKSEKREKTAPTDNPLNEPPTISGGYNQISQTKQVDKDNNWITNSAFEPFTGDVLQRIIAQPTVTIGMNVATLPLSFIATSINRLNSTPMWGFAARQVRLVDAPWSREYVMTNNGTTAVAFVYYKVTYTFECNFDGWDVPLLDEGLKVLKEGGDSTNPLHFIRATDLGGEKEDQKKLLDGSGSRLPDGDPLVFITPQIEAEANFLALGIPTVI